LKNLAVIGGGSWGTALAIVLAPRFAGVRFWVYEKDLAARMTVTRENDVYLPGVLLPANVEIHAGLAACLKGADIVLGVMPSHVARSVYQQALAHLQPSMVFVSATKGLENGTLLRVSEVIAEVVQPKFLPRVAVMSGPTFAREVARGEPTALVVASADQPLAEAVQNAFSGPTFRLYTSPDPVGVEIGGAVKNVVAIGAGVCHGLGLGSNAMAALITRGLAEMTRLAVALGGRPSTLAGLAGLGDLVLTCTGDLSRNRKVGMELAKGRKLEEIVSSMQMVAEGIKTTNAAVDLARRYSVEMPIAEQMHAMLHEGRQPREAIRLLMERTLKPEVGPATFYGPAG
jgi:glycerol-3-phosphate dehydrogenase (NAD(P)+)